MYGGINHFTVFLQWCPEKEKKKQKSQTGDLSFRQLLPIAAGRNANGKNCTLATKAAAQIQWCSQGGLPVFLTCNINIQIVADKLCCLFPLPQIPEHVQEVLLQAKTGERKSRMKEKEQQQRLKQCKKLSLDTSSLNCFNSLLLRATPEKITLLVE